MASWRPLVVLTIVMGGTFAIIAASRADEDSVAVSSPDQIEQLLDRIEKLERRVEALEGRQQVARQIDGLFVPAGGWLTNLSVAAKPALSHGALIVPPKAEQPTRGVFLPRHIELKPE